MVVGHGDAAEICVFPEGLEYALLVTADLPGIYHAVRPATGENPVVFAPQQVSHPPVMSFQSVFHLTRISIENTDILTVSREIYGCEKLASI